MATNPKDCRCPVRPYYSLGSWASGSAHENALLDRWQAEHGGHPYAQARDELSGALQHAERQVGSGSAVLAMVADIFSLPRESVGPQNASEAVRSVHERIARRAAEESP